MTQFLEIERFLQLRGKNSLFSYLNLSQEASPQAVRATLQKRRAWAYAQQHNPRHRDEALWLIRNLRCVSDALTTNRARYLSSQTRAQLRKQARHIAHFIMIMGVSPETRPLIRRYAQRSGLSEQHITALLQHHAQRYSSVA
jgi:hypothetical protein